MAKKSPEKLVVPSSRGELANYVAEIGRLQRVIITANAEFDKEIAGVNGRRAERVTPLEAQLKTFVDGAAAYAQVNRNELTDNRKTNTVVIETGTICWRLSPWKCTVRKADELIKLMVARAKRNKLIASLLRSKVEFDKEFAIANREEVQKLGLPGVDFSQDEVLTIKPIEVERNLEVSAAQLKRLISQ